eukprot:CAMPEP_0172380874 /NCGR_PEP_ID=MMETSP1060-20121228/70662_1 /TAXON_ID=37318 /ORGANISM="Pseudo-nitzschia pungens, Strain cf. cingulata" /LENGTH=783 /DNA_ID=CAMNT_0013108639 /DNA_START=77 /DNA_END=2429 /DNA_ORIENTATION=-
MTEAGTESGKKEGQSKFGSIFSSSCAASVFMAAYVSFAMLNLYGMMYPLTRVNLDDFAPDSFIRPLWDTEAKIAMKVYLSTKARYSSKDIVLLWQQRIDTPSLSKTFLISSLDCINEEKACTADNTSDQNGASIDPSLKFAQEWLDSQDKASMEDDGTIFSTIQSAAGQGIESTSILLTLGQSVEECQFRIRNLGIGKGYHDERNYAASKGILERSNVHLPASSPIWSNLMNNATIYVHVVLVRDKFFSDNSDLTLNQANMALGQASRSHGLLLGKVDLLKYDPPSHLAKPNRILLWDVSYLFRKYILRDRIVGRPPWDMEFTKPEYFAAYQQMQQMKAEGRGYPYWKPEVAVKYLIDEDAYPMDIAHVSGMDFVRVQSTTDHPSGLAHIPALHVDEIGLTSDKYIPINETVTSLPLRISFDRSDMQGEENGRASTATAGGISPARWRLLTHLSASLESQRELGFEQSDIDDLRRLIADTNVTLLGITVLASALHMLFEFLTFKNEVSFWKNNSDLTGLSVRSLFLDMIGQFIIVLYLIEQETSFLMTITSTFGVLVALWKCKQAAGFALVPLSDEDKEKKCSVINILPRMFGYQFKATRLQSSSAPSDGPSSKDDAANAGKTNENAPDLEALTLEADRQATVWLGSVLLPLVFGYTIYSLIQQEHASWYSWLITSASSGVYAFGFVLMTPQLFLNYKMKSVAHLPWRVLVYKSLNTFIDDLFAFIIRMPTMARMSCFRDDIVFFIYLYQRWLYPVDASRPVEGGGEGESVAQTKVSDDKKNL